MEADEREDATSMDDQGDASALRRDPVAGDAGGDGELLPGPVHDLGARGDGAPLGGGAPRGAGAAVPGDRAANRSVDDDGDAGRALAAPRRGRLPGGARPRGRAVDSPQGSAR